MAVSQQLECHPVSGCLSHRTSSGMMAQRQPFPVSRPATTKGVSAIIPAIVNSLINAYKLHQSRVELGRLTDDQLRDMGLVRGRDGIKPCDRF